MTIKEIRNYAQIIHNDDHKIQNDDQRNFKFRNDDIKKIRMIKKIKMAI